MAIKVSTAWSKSKEFKQPFYYALGKGVQTDLTPEQADEWNPDEQGQLILVHRLDMGDLLELGIAEQMDFMSKELMTSDADKAKAAEAVSTAIKKSANFKQMQKMIDLVAQAGVLEPKIYPVPEHEAARQKGLFYVDEIPWDERMEIFTLIFETEGLSTFREEQEPSVGNVEHVPSVQLPADGPVDVRSDDTEGVLLQ